MPTPPPPEHTRFRPGQSGNPGGRPKSKPVTDRLRRRLELPARDALKLGDGATLADLIALRMARAAAEGDFKYVRELLDRVEGKPVQSVETHQETVTVVRRDRRARRADGDAGGTPPDPAAGAG